MTPAPETLASTKNTSVQSGAKADNTGFFLVGGYLSLLGLIRLFEALPLALGPYVVEGFPDWLLPYLAFLAALVCGSGFLLIFAGIRSRSGSPNASRWSMLAGTGIFLFAAMHALFLVFYEQAFADGGLIWGVVHLLTLTRLQTTGTEAGVAGYQVGLGVGIVLWIAMGFYVVAESALRLREIRSRESKPESAEATSLQARASTSRSSS